MDHDVQFLIAILAVNLIILPIRFIIIKSRNEKNKTKTSTKTRITLFILTEYFICLVAVTIIPLPFSKMGSPYLNLDPFHQTYNNFLSAWHHTSSRTIWNEIENLIGNIIIFFPLGFLLPLLYLNFRHFFKVFLIAVLCSLFIESVQYSISIDWGYNRIADIDDLILNVMGAICGFVVYKICQTFLK